MSNDWKRRLGYREDYDENNRTVKQEDVGFNGKTYWVSTVDLGLDHSFGYGPPLYFETMVFERVNGQVDYSERYCNRYPTRHDALNGHNRLVDALNNGNIKVDEYGSFELEGGQSQCTQQSGK